MEIEPDIFERTASRLSRSVAALGCAGAIVAFAWLGWRAGFGFALGASAAWFNFRWLKRFVAGLGPGSKTSRFSLFFAFRYIILAAGGYVILRYSKASLPAALTGLFVPLAAAIIEVLIQLRYERRDLDH